jgi:hypothetical protein
MHLRLKKASKGTNSCNTTKSKCLYEIASHQVKDAVSGKREDSIQGGRDHSIIGMLTPHQQSKPIAL